jgi:hypothetical protein
MCPQGIQTDTRRKYRMTGKFDEFFYADQGESPQAPEAGIQETGTPEGVPDDGVERTLTVEDIHEFTARFSGKDGDGRSCAVASYQCYNLEALDADGRIKGDTPIFNLTKPYVQFSFDELNPQFALLDFIFPSYDDQELRIFWARLQKWRRETAETPVFFIHLLERASVSMDTRENDVLLEANILNPVLFTLTRELPTTKAADDLVDGELTGGNIVRMMLDMSLVTFELSMDNDTRDIKAEVQREAEEERYMENAQPEQLWQ